METLQDLAITFTTLCLSTGTCHVEFENSRLFLSCWAILRLSVLVMSPKFVSQPNLISVFLSFERSLMQISGRFCPEADIRGGA